MKTRVSVAMVSSIVVMVFSMFTSCQKDMAKSGNAQYESVLDVSGDGTSMVIGQNMQLALVETSALTDAEVVSLLKMKEEEKLARDVYSALYQKWGSPVFSRISVAENNHLNAIVNLLKYYGEADTLISDAGTFADANVQTLYNNLVSQGSAAVEEGYKTGALIEEMDLKDLGEVIATTSNTNIIMVYENLERGSRNHLRAFYRQLTALGIVYTPAYLTQAEYDQIVSSSMEKGKQYRMIGNGKGHGNGNCNGSGQGKRKGRG